MLRRRDILISAAALGGGALLLGGASLSFRDNYGPWIREVLRKALPGHALDATSLEQYVREYTAGKDSIKLEIYAMAESFSDPAAVMPSNLVTKIVEEERRILTGFLMYSDFFETTPPPQKITYLGHDGCRNPFATF